MPYIIPQPSREETTPYVFYKDLFKPEECAEIIQLHKQIKQSDALVGGIGDKGVVDPEKRKSDLYWINWGPGLNGIFERLANNIFQANHKWWGFHLSGLNESLQLTHYKSDVKAHYEWHEDWNESAGFSHRKISGVVLLSDKFSGGEFEFLHSGKVEEMTAGSMILFPSFRTHKVNPVTDGERWSLVFWVSGPPFI